jgi:hypothetical protein
MELTEDIHVNRVLIFPPLKNINLYLIYYKNFCKCDNIYCATIKINK